MASRFVSIWFCHLIPDWITLHHQELKNKPFVLTEPVHGRLVITAANHLALAQGIVGGMVLADARAFVADLVALDFQPTLPHRLLKKIAEWLIRFSPLTAVDGCDGILMDASGCTHLWGSDEQYCADISARLKAKGYAARVAIADTIGAAWAVARYGRGSLIIPKGSQKEFLLSLPPQSLRLNSAIVERLNKLGLKQIKNFISMPSSALRRRFGTEIVVRLKQALGLEKEFIQPIIPPEPFSFHLPCLEPIVTLTGITIALEELLKQACDRLKKEGKGLRQAKMKCYRVDGQLQEVEIGTTHPSHHAAHIFKLFEEKLSSIQPDLGIELFILEASKVEEHLPPQKAFWQQQGGLNNHEIAELIDRIALRVHPSGINRYLPEAHWWPERSFKSVNDLNAAPVIEWKVDRPRPIELLPTPERIEVTAPVPDYPPMNFRYKGELHVIKKADGPERIEQEWWIEEGEHRDYYTVEDESGSRYWLFRLGHYDAEKSFGWFLHGLFP